MILNGAPSLSLPCKMRKLVVRLIAIALAGCVCPPAMGDGGEPLTVFGVTLGESLPDWGEVHATEGEELQYVEKEVQGFTVVGYVCNGEESVLQVNVYRAIETTGYGNEVRSAYQERKAVVAEEHGEPPFDVDFLRWGRRNTVAAEPERWMRTLQNRYRFLFAIWDVGDSYTIVLEAKARTTTSGVVTLTYRDDKAFSECINVPDQNADALP